jgi:hypothetical protein
VRVCCCCPSIRILHPIRLETTDSPSMRLHRSSAGSRARETRLPPNAAYHPWRVPRPQLGLASPSDHLLRLTCYQSNLIQCRMVDGSYWAPATRRSGTGHHRMTSPTLERRSGSYYTVRRNSPFGAAIYTLPLTPSSPSDSACRSPLLPSPDPGPSSASHLHSPCPADADICPYAAPLPAPTPAPANEPSTPPISTFLVGATSRAYPSASIRPSLTHLKVSSLTRRAQSNTYGGADKRPIKNRVLGEGMDGR